MPSEYIIPGAGEPEAARELLGRLGLAEEAQGTSITKPANSRLSSQTGAGVDLPPSIAAVLRQAAEIIAQGKSVSVVPRDPVLTVREAASVLGVSPATVERLLAAGVLPVQTQGARRPRVRLEDVLEVHGRRREGQYQAILATSEDFDQDD